jgi:hypothetical protein
VYQSLAISKKDSERDREKFKESALIRAPECLVGVSMDIRKCEWMW